MSLEEFEKMIQQQSSYLEELIESGKVFYEEHGKRTYVTSIEEYIELKSMGKIIESE